MVVVLVVAFYVRGIISYLGLVKLLNLMSLVLRFFLYITNKYCDEVTSKDCFLLILRGSSWEKIIVSIGLFLAIVIRLLVNSNMED